MLITITNLPSKPAKKYIEENKNNLPTLRLTKFHAYNGVIVDVEDDNAQDLVEALDAEGFIWESEENIKERN